MDAYGTASVGGFIESLFDYRGHFGVDPIKLSAGLNKGMSVDTVVNHLGQTVSAPPFQRAYAGAGRSADTGDMHSLWIDRSGNVYTAGNNNKGQLCLGDTTSRNIPQQVSLPGFAVGAAVGADFSLILLENGKVFGCGSNEVGEIGLGPNISSSSVPNDGVSVFAEPFLYPLLR